MAVGDDKEKGAPDWIELRPDHEGAFDELVARFSDGMVHIETLDDGSVYLGFYKPGEGATRSGLQLWITSRGKLSYNHSPIGPPPSGT